MPGTHKLVAVSSGGGSGTEILARVDLLHDWIVQKIAASGGAVGGGSSAGSSASFQRRLGLRR